MTAHPPGRGGYVLYVIGTFPLLTTTFIDREVGALRAAGVDLRVVSLRRPAGPLSPEQEELQRGVRYTLPIPPFRLLAALTAALTRHPVILARLLVGLPTGAHPGLGARLKTIGHVVVGVYVWARLRADPPRHVHAHFLDRATTVAMVVARLSGIDYSATGHANDIYVRPVLLGEKVAGARFVATCTGFNLAHLAELAPGANLALVHHGLDLERYPLAPAGGSGAGRIVTVAQLKEKKGLTHLVAACGLLVESGRSIRCDIIGDGPLRAELAEQVRAAGLEEHVRLLGSLPHRQVVERLQQATLFVLPSVVAGDGDRDGIPNVILEAMAVALPVVSTRISGIPEAVVDGVTGILVDPGDPGELARAMIRLLDDPAAAGDMGRRGRQRVQEMFEVGHNARALQERLLA